MCNNIIGTLLGILVKTKDNFMTRLDFVPVGICKELVCCCLESIIGMLLFGKYEGSKFLLFSYKKLCPY